MSLYTKPLSRLTWADLEDLLKARAVENVRLEFKRESPARDELLKKISSFANTYGGHLIVGAEGNSNGELVGLPGVEKQLGYKQTIVQWCADGATPFLDVDASDPIPDPTGTGRVCYVVHARESDLAPHFLNGRKGVWVRTNEFSGRFEAKLADETEPRHLFDRCRVVRERRAGMLERARERWQVFVRRYYKGESGGADVMGASFTLAVVPRFPSRHLCDHSELNRLLAEQRVPWRNSGFPYPHGDLISQDESALARNPGESFSILETNIYGMCHYATEVQLKRETFSGIHLNHLVGHLLVFLEHARAFLRAAGYGGPLLIQIRLDGVCGIPWVFFEGGSIPIRGPASEVDDRVTIELDTSTDLLGENRDAVAGDVLKAVFFALNWAGAADGAEKLGSLIRGGYAFNFWQDH